MVSEPWVEKREIGPCTLYLGDAFTILPAIPETNFAAVVCDPPYLIGAKSQGGKSKAGSFYDLMNFGRWAEPWLRATRMKLDAGHMFWFGSWRTLPAMMYGLDQAGWCATSCVSWDKLWIGPASPSAMRGRWELILHATSDDALFCDRSRPDRVDCKWQAANMRKYGHPSEKPESVIHWLLESLAPGPIGDWFMGSGTVGAVAVKLGREYVGIEIDPAHYATACARIERAWAASHPTP